MDNKKDTQSAWDATAPETQKFPTLHDKIEVDIAIIGGGMTGLTTAFELSKKGKKIAVLESYKIGRGTTGYSTGNLYVPVQPFYQNILKKFNLRTVADIVRSRNLALNYIEGTVIDNNIDCHFARRPWYLYTNLDKNRSFLEDETNTLKKVGVEINYTKDLDLPFPYKKAAVIQNQARFHPLKYVLGLASLLQETQCQIYENSPVISVEEVNKKCVVTTKAAKVYAKKVLMATHVPKGILPVQLFEAPYRSYVVAAKLKNNDYPKGNYWDLDEPGYVTSSHRLASNSSDELDILMVAGSHHKTGQHKNYKKIMDYVKKNYDVESIEYMWSAQHYQAADDVPYIGLVHKRSNNIYLATGYFADGLAYGTVASLLLTDLMTDTKNELSEIYNRPLA